MSANEGGGGMSQFGDILLTAFLLLASFAIVSIICMGVAKSRSARRKH
jgi:hypothetical protein